MDGILRCTRYAFGPNRLHYCGPDANREIFGYLKNDLVDPGLAALLRRFQTMFPYLRMIAAASGIRDPFDDRVVEAYWIGNELLDRVDKPAFYRHLAEGLELKRKLTPRAFDLVAGKIGQGALPHHSFHVFDIWKRTGNTETEHTMESLDECRISWGTVKTVDGPNILVETEPIIYMDGKLKLGPPVPRKIRRDLGALLDIEQLQPGEIVTIHWGVPCEVVSPAQAAALRRYTLQSIGLANETI